MIIAGSPEEQILSELKEDIVSVKRHAKKLAEKELRALQKRGISSHDEDYFAAYVTSKNNNDWFFFVVVAQGEKIPWAYSACCIVEAENNSRDYYVIRGLNTEQPYFIKYTTHALKRYKERTGIEDEGVMEFYAAHMFYHRETGICVKFTEMKYLLMFRGMDDAEDLTDMSYMAMFHGGIFLAKRTPLGNYIFKTYISTEMAKKEMDRDVDGKPTKYKNESEMVFFALHLHQYYNKNLYSEEALNNVLYASLGKDFRFKEDKSMYLLLKH